MDNYQALARTWRPKEFNEFIGQEHAVKTLVNSLNNNRVHHAYLLSGTRGVGKTTLARILAKCISCQDKISSTPCNTCASCVSIDNGSYLDITEVDAASRTKVEDTRELLDNLHFAPSIGKYKIFIIDEVHMLSKHSFNALLKTLEEPPPHVKFIFATTEVDKLPVTIVSRCVHFKLKSLPQIDIQNHLEKVLTFEKVKFESSAIVEIAKAARGSIRDSLSLLEQTMAFCGHEISLSDIYKILGVIDSNHIHELFLNILERDPVGAIKKVHVLAEIGVDFYKILEEILTLLHDIALAQASHKLIDDSHASKELILKYTTLISQKDVQLLYQIALIGRKDLAYSPNIQMGFEILIIRMICFQPGYEENTCQEQVELKTKPSISKQYKDIAKIVDKPKNKNSDQIKAPQVQHTYDTKQKNVKPVQQEVKEVTTKTTPISNTVSTLNIDWPETTNNLELRGIAKIIASHCIVTKYENNSMELELDLDKANLLSDNIKDQILRALEDELENAIKLSINIGSGNNENTPSYLLQQQTAKQISDEKDILLQDDNAKEIMNKFQAEITDIDLHKK